MAEITTIVSAAASVISAIGGAAACIAAFRSAGHAQKVFNENQKIEKTFALRQLSITAHQVAVEVERIKWSAQGLKVAYKTLAVFAGAVGGSRQTLMLQEVEDKVKAADCIKEKASPFVKFNTLLLNGPLEEISNREILISQLLAEATALRERIEIEFSEIQAQNAMYREKVVQGA
ncbi:hypothetical protein HXX02_15445 [Microbulbifer elongatus]|uniref:Uncharacterized protein n=1 Tax=Microbulbifer elongatus TaxID=86173 RepID=A0ABT1P3Z4_9GAMM|nr:hypothetical protein [Microbulbifer elongatus]MCQ3830832.1 hypothetical protein [Microbulbifer elongatus]